MHFSFQDLKSNMYVCMELLLDYPLWNYKVESQCVTN